MFTSALFLGSLAASAVATPFIFDVTPVDLFKRISSSCSTTGQASCHNTTKQTNSCCFEAPGVSIASKSFKSYD